MGEGEKQEYSRGHFEGFGAGRGGGRHLPLEEALELMMPVKNMAV